MPTAKSEDSQNSPAPSDAEELELTPKEIAALDRAANKVFEDMALDGLPVFRPDPTKKPLPT
jgi:hypothetical protein